MKFEIQNMFSFHTHIIETLAIGYVKWRDLFLPVFEVSSV